jgi:hypothetical protein
VLREWQGYLPAFSSSKDILVQASLLARICAHESSLSLLLQRQRELADAFGAEWLRTSFAMQPGDLDGEFSLMLTEQVEAVSRAHRAAGEQAGKVEWMLATARDLRALAGQHGADRASVGQRGPPAP